MCELCFNSRGKSSVTRRSTSDYQSLLDQMADTRLKPWVDVFQQMLDNVLAEEKHGDLARWRRALADLPRMPTGTMDFNTSAVTVGNPEDCDETTQAQIREALMGLHPWRKGPFDIFGVHIDTEWRSDWKWDRVVPAIAPLTNRKVLDIGCGSGYHLWAYSWCGRKARYWYRSITTV